MLTCWFKNKKISTYRPTDHICIYIQCILVSQNTLFSLIVNRLVYIEIKIAVALRPLFLFYLRNYFLLQHYSLWNESIWVLDRPNAQKVLYYNPLSFNTVRCVYQWRMSFCWLVLLLHLDQNYQAVTVISCELRRTFPINRLLLNCSIYYLIFFFKYSFALEIST